MYRGARLMRVAACVSLSRARPRPPAAHQHRGQRHPRMLAARSAATGHAIARSAAPLSWAIVTSLQWGPPIWPGGSAFRRCRWPPERNPTPHRAQRHKAIRTGSAESPSRRGRELRAARRRPARARPRRGADLHERDVPPAADERRARTAGGLDAAGCCGRGRPLPAQYGHSSIHSTRVRARGADLHTAACPRSHRGAGAPPVGQGEGEGGA
jgi:hypothetical protein